MRGRRKERRKNLRWKRRSKRTETVAFSEDNPEIEVDIGFGVGC
jgi:hypothetical protein